MVDIGGLESNIISVYFYLETIVNKVLEFFGYLTFSFRFYL